MNTDFAQTKANQDIFERIKQRITIFPNGCWIVSGWDDGKGYKKISVKGHGVYCHVFVYRFFHGRLMPKQQVDHKCCNRSCCNPDHLQKVTNRVNSRLRDKRKRAREKCKA